MPVQQRTKKVSVPEVPGIVIRELPEEDPEQVSVPEVQGVVVREEQQQC